MSRVLDLLDRYHGLKRKRDQWLPLYQELADVLLPSRAVFTASSIPGAQENPEIYDGTPRLARRGLATAIDSLLKPKTTRWFWMRAEDDALNESDDAKRWFDAVGDAMWAHIYDPAAGFIPQSAACDNDISAFGWSPLWMGERSARNGLLFRSLFIGDVAIDESVDGVIDTACISRRYTARQAKQKWPEEGKLGRFVNEALTSTDKTQKDKEFEFVECIYPNADRDYSRRDSVNLPFTSCIVCVEDEMIVDDSGYHEFPLAVPRWEMVPGQVYPRSPGMIALPDARTLQAMGKTLLIGGENAVDPPRWVVDDGSLAVVRTWPGGVTPVSLDTVKDIGGPPIGTLDLAANIPIGKEMQDDYRQMVEAAFFKNVFNLPIEGRQMTATEILERKEEFLRTIGPTLGQLENDYIGAIVNRVFGILSRASFTEDGRPIPGGPIPPAPESIQRAGARFEFMSPVQQAKRQIEAAGFARAMEIAGPLLELDPEVADNFDGDEIARNLPEAFSFPSKYIRSLEKVQERRQARRQAQAGAAALEEGTQAAGIAKQVADIAAMAGQAA